MPPFTKEDAHKRNKATRDSDHLADVWVGAANSSYDSCIDEGRTAKFCEGRAFRIANSAVGEEQDKHKGTEGMAMSDLINNFFFVRLGDSPIQAGKLGKPYVGLMKGVFRASTGIVPVDEQLLTDLHTVYQTEGREVPMAVEHKEGPAPGHIVDTFLGEVLWDGDDIPALYLIPEWNNLGEWLVNNKIYRFTSISFERKSRRTREDSLTNYPAMPQSPLPAVEMHDGFYTLSDQEQDVNPRTQLLEHLELDPNTIDLNAIRPVFNKIRTWGGLRHYTGLTDGQMDGLAEILFGDDTPEPPVEEAPPSAKKKFKLSPLRRARGVATPSVSKAEETPPQEPPGLSDEELKAIGEVLLEDEALFVEGNGTTYEFENNEEVQGTMQIDTAKMTSTDKEKLIKMFMPEIQEKLASEQKAQTKARKDLIKEVWPEVEAKVREESEWEEKVRAFADQIANKDAVEFAGPNGAVLRASLAAPADRIVKLVMSLKREQATELFDLLTGFVQLTELNQLGSRNDGKIVAEGKENPTERFRAKIREVKEERKLDWNEAQLAVEREDPDLAEEHLAYMRRGRE
ncbi:MAG: hypothetical protein ACE5H0_09130 [Bacteroidota bacterium]